MNLQQLEGISDELDLIYSLFAGRNASEYALVRLYCNDNQSAV